MPYCPPKSLDHGDSTRIVLGLGSKMRSDEVVARVLEMILRHLMLTSMEHPVGKCVRSLLRGSRFARLQLVFMGMPPSLYEVLLRGPALPVHCLLLVSTHCQPSPAMGR